MGLPILTILIAVPLIAGALCLFVNANGARWIALIATRSTSPSVSTSGRLSIRQVHNGSLPSS